MSMLLINKQPKLKSAMAAMLFLGVMLGNANNADATQKIYRPYVEKGELEFEWRASHDYDDDNDTDGAEKQKFAIGYGFTDRWFSEIYAEIEKEGSSNSEYEFTAVEWENKFQLTEKGQYWLDAGFLVEYDQKFENDSASKLEAKLILEKELGKTSHTLNFEYEQEVGKHANGSPAGGLSWGSRYRLSPHFEPGFEYYADFGHFNDSNDYEEQSHQFGPAIYGELPYGFKYDLGYLFGISRAAPDGRLKAILEYEIHF